MIKMKNHKILIVLVLTIFGSLMTNSQETLSLSEALHLAEQQNLNLKVQVLDEVNNENIIKGIKREWVPTLDFESNFSHYFDRQVIFLPGSFTGSENEVEGLEVGGLNQFSSSIVLNQKIFSDVSRKKLRSANVNNEIVKNRTNAIRDKLNLDVIQSYYQVLLIESQIRLLENSLNRNDKSLQDARSFFIEGKGIKVDTLKSFIDVETIKISITQQRSALELSKLKLKQLLGVNETIDLILSDSLVVEHGDLIAPDLGNEGLIASNRYDLINQSLNVDLSLKELELTKSMLSPEISLIGKYSFQSQSDQFNLSNVPVYNTSFIGLNVSIPIFKGGVTSAKINQHKINIDREKAKLMDLEDRAKLEIRTMLNNWLDNKNQFEIHNKIVEAAEKNFEINYQRYTNGLSSKLELADAELALTRANLNRLQSIYNLKICKAELLKSLGQLSI